MRLNIAERLDKTLHLFSEASRRQLMHELGFTEPAPGRTLADLKDTIGPATDQAYSRSTGERVSRWTPWEIMNALRPIISRMAAQYSSGGWTARKGGDLDPEIFKDLVQNALLAVTDVIGREADEMRDGNSYVTWIQNHIRGAIGPGTALSEHEPDRAARGFVNNLAGTNNPAIVQRYLDEIDERDRGRNPRRPKEGNRFGEHAPELARLAQDYLNVINSGDKAAIDEKRADLKELAKNEYGRTRILSARTGLHDPISFAHSETPGSRYIRKIIAARSIEELQSILDNPPRNMAGTVRDMVKELRGAVERGNMEQIRDLKLRLEQWVREQNDRDAFRAAHKFKGTHTQGKGEGGETEVERPGMPATPDSFVAQMESKEAVAELLRRGLEGVEVGTKPDGQPDIIKFSTQEFRVLIRLFGIKDYPTKNTGSDVEFDEARYQEMYQKLMAAAGNPDAEVVFTPSSSYLGRHEPNRREAGMVIDEVARHIGDGNYRDTMEVRDSLKQYFSTHGTVLVLLRNDKEGEDLADELAALHALSRWVREGCEKMDPKQIADDFGVSAPRMSTILKTALGPTTPPSSGIGKKGQKGAGPLANPKVAYPNMDSKMVKIWQAVRDELGYSGEEYEPRSEARDRLFQGALFKLRAISESMLNQAIAEGYDAVDRRIIERNHQMIGRAILDYAENYAGRP